MITAEILFEKINGTASLEDQAGAINSLLGAWRMNGQIMGTEFPTAQQEKGVSVFLMLPKPDALDGIHDNRYTKDFRDKLANVGLEQPKIRLIGEDPLSMEPCACPSLGGLVLFTTYVCLESPLRCGECFQPVPLYEIPKTYDDEYYDIICWQSDYQACDRLQMGCETGERFGTKEMASFDSSLSKRGLAICARLKELTGLDAYYYLYRHSGKSLKSEQARRCPGCGGEWLLSTPLHGRFDFRCERCKLLSNIAFSLPN